VLGLVAFYDRTWNEQWTSTIGYSLVHIENSDGQAASAFRLGQYALVNLLWTPVDNLMLGQSCSGEKGQQFDGFG